MRLDRTEAAMDIQSGNRPAADVRIECAGDRIRAPQFATGCRPIMPIGPKYTVRPAMAWAWWTHEHEIVHALGQAQP